MKTPREVADDCMVYSMGEVDEAPTLARIESAILAERERWRAFADEKGEPRKVLGEFKYTNDGSIACEEGDCWCVFRRTEDDPWQVSPCRRSGNPTDYGCWWQVDDCDSDGVSVGSVWSTKAAALAAAAKGVGK